MVLMCSFWVFGFVGFFFPESRNRVVFWFWLFGVFLPGYAYLKTNINDIQESPKGSRRWGQKLYICKEKKVYGLKMGLSWPGNISYQKLWHFLRSVKGKLWCYMPATQKILYSSFHIFISIPSWNIAEENRPLFKNRNISSTSNER